MKNPVLRELEFLEVFLGRCSQEAEHGPEKGNTIMKLMLKRGLPACGEAVL